jgi:hypothetical protein
MISGALRPRFWKTRRRNEQVIADTQRISADVTEHKRLDDRHERRP